MLLKQAAYLIIIRTSSSLAFFEKQFETFPFKKAFNLLE